MGEKIVVGPINKGLINNRTPFVIDNDSFPTLINAYQWRGRVKRKRGTTQLGRLSRYFDSTSAAFNPGTTTQILSAGGASNLITGFTSSGIQTGASIVPGSVTINNVTTAVVYTDPAMDGTLSPGGTINYATGAFVISPAAADTINANFNYYPDLPVMGLEDLVVTDNQFPGNLGFDTVYSYRIKNTFPYTIFNTSFYKNLSTGTYSAYVQKSVWTPTTWNGQDYQQFWTTNYQGALWATNGINVPFDITNIGMQYKAITTVTVTSATTTSLVIATHGLVVGDFVFINEVATTTGINFQTGYVITVTDANTVVVKFPSATIATDGTGGIAQYLTNRSDTTKDCLRWYDGDPVTSATPPIFTTGSGWVNFAPPLLSASTTTFSISDLPPNQYYLVGARLIVPFKDRLLFFGPVVQTSAAGSQRYLQDTVIYSQNGTPFYTASFPYNTNVPSPSIIPTTAFKPILVPTNQTATPSAYWEDVTGYGGFIQAGIDQPITTVINNEDVLLVGFTNKQTRFVYTGNDIVPFLFYITNSELGSSSTFSAVTLDRGAISIGPNGIILSTQIGSQRIDLEIPDQIFQFNLLNNGTQRVTAQRDFINEWIYFSYSPDGAIDYFPGQTLFYNYRDNSWAIFNECYTTYGQFRKQSGQTWDDLTEFTWDEWTDPWDSGEQTVLQPEVIAGNQQGFVMFLSEGTGEDNSEYISNISASSVVTSPHHNFNVGDYIVITGALGTIGAQVNGKIFSVANPDVNTFTLNPTISTGTYLGGGLITRMYVPQIQTKQFPVSWGIGRKTRLGPQQYLLTTTSTGQITLLIFLSQNENNAYNMGPILPDPLSINDSLIYSTILYTCPESTNLGLTPANTNLQMLTAPQQAQIWHRMNTGLIGDSIQIGFTLSDAQMRDVDFNNQFVEIELHSFILDVNPSSVLA